GEIVVSVKRVTDIMGEISAATNEQSTQISEVNAAVGQLDQMTQQNAALVEEGAASAESLKEQAGALNGIVSAFKLGHEAKSPGPRASAADRPSSKPDRMTRDTARPREFSGEAADSTDSAGVEPPSYERPLPRRASA